MKGVRIVVGYAAAAEPDRLVCPVRTLTSGLVSLQAASPATAMASATTLFAVLITSLSLPDELPHLPRGGRPASEVRAMRLD